MFPRVSALLGAAVLVGAASFGPVAHAATVDSLTILKFDRSELAQAQQARQDFIDGHSGVTFHTETFEGYEPWNGTSGTSDLSNTKVGSFSKLGQDGSGGSVVGDPSKLQVRNDNTMKSGRYNTYEPATDGNWLDSNDNTGMRWQVGGVGTFDFVSFYVIDAADVGGRFSMQIGDSSYADIAGGKRLANGNIFLVFAQLSEAVENLVVDLMHNRTNDGFGVDGATAARVAPIPVPPAAALALTGLLAFAGLRRRALRASG